MNGQTTSTPSPIQTPSPLGCPRCGSSHLWVLSRDVLVEQLACVDCGQWWLATRTDPRPTAQTA